MLGRDPIAAPLTAREWALFQRALGSYLEREFSAPEPKATQPDPEE